MFWFSVGLLIDTIQSLLGVLFNWEFGKKSWQKGKPYQTHDYFIAFFVFAIALGLFIYAAIFG
ncbi:hypothetical protein [Zunongwangia sp. HRR-M8]|uniref:hypothetical protein n=1 Tax=Zunongwangia sp. HRR-M8 TaxID=3015170 RepID=UPI0022DD4090|nr:hypothetical protein [Zunongwangia sp. HRR-M8]WBL23548.1 hypothetical protein PBT89_06200 [Zunongwangia sp. HRR-M8]